MAGYPLGSWGNSYPELNGQLTYVDGWTNHFNKHIYFEQHAAISLRILRIQ